MFSAAHLALEKNETSQRWVKEWTVQISSDSTQRCGAVTFSSSPRNFGQLSTEECQLLSTVQTSYCLQQCGKHNNTLVEKQKTESRTQQYFRRETETWVNDEGKTLPTFAKLLSCPCRCKLNCNFTIVWLIFHFIVTNIAKSIVHYGVVFMAKCTYDKVSQCI